MERHSFEDWTAIEIDARFDGAINTIGSGDGHGEQKDVSSIYGTPFTAQALKYRA